MENVKSLCRKNYQDGVNFGYQKGFEAGVKAALVLEAAPSFVLPDLNKLA